MIKEAIIKFLDKEGIAYLIDMAKKDKFFLAWGSCMYGNVGMETRNYLIKKFPNIFDNFKDYGDFEDYVTDVTIEILKEHEVCITK